jgi:hypothetical protein
MILGFLALAVLFLAAAGLPIAAQGWRIGTLVAAMVCALLAALAAFGVVAA